MCMLVLPLLVAACAAPPFEMGRAAPTDKVDRLISDRTTRAEVIALLGQPRGYGLMRHTPDQPLRDVLVYERLRIKGDQIGVDMLLVYLNEDRYDGYLWFSAKELLKTAP